MGWTGHSQGRVYGGAGGGAAAPPRRCPLRKNVTKIWKKNASKSTVEYIHHQNAW